MKHQFIIFIFTKQFKNFFIIENQFILKLLIHIKINKKLDQLKCKIKTKHLQFYNQQFSKEIPFKLPTHKSSIIFVKNAISLLSKFKKDCFKDNFFPKCHNKVLMLIPNWCKKSLKKMISMKNLNKNFFDNKPWNLSEE